MIGGEFRMSGFTSILSFTDINLIGETIIGILIFFLSAHSLDIKFPGRAALSISD